MDARLLILLLVSLYYVHGQGNVLKIANMFSTATRSRFGRVHVNTAIAHLNNKTDGWWDDILPNHTISVTYFNDNCNNQATRSATINSIKAGNIAIIGYSCTAPFLYASSLADFGGIPLINTQVTDVTLSDKTLFPNVYKMIASDSAEVSAILDYCVRNSWRSVALIHDDNLYGVNFGGYLYNTASSYGINIAQRSIYRRSYLSVTQAMQIWTGIRDQQLRIVIVVGTATDFLVLIQAFNALQLPTANYQMIASSSAFRQLNSTVSTGLTGVTSFLWTPPQGMPLTDAYRQVWNSSNITPALQAFVTQAFAGANANLFYNPDPLSQHLNAYDSVIMWAKTIDTMMRQGLNYTDFATFNATFTNLTFTGISGLYSFDPTTGDLKTSIAQQVWNIRPNGNISQIGMWNNVGPNSASRFSFTDPPMFSTGGFDIPTDGQCVQTCFPNGVCDYNSQTCSCNPGFSGSSCQVISPLVIPTSSFEDSYSVPCFNTMLSFTFTVTESFQVINIMVSNNEVQKSDLSGTLNATLTSLNNGRIMPNVIGDTFYNFRIEIRDDPGSFGNYTLVLLSPRRDCKNVASAVTLSSSVIYTVKDSGSVRLAGSVTGIFLFVIFGLFGLLLFLKRNSVVFKSASITFTSLILLGAVVNTFPILIGTLIASTPVYCSMFNWLNLIGFTMVFMALFIKNYRVYLIFYPAIMLDDDDSAHNTANHVSKDGPELVSNSSHMKPVVPNAPISANSVRISAVIGTSPKKSSNLNEKAKRENKILSSHFLKDQYLVRYWGFSIVAVAIYLVIWEFTVTTGSVTYLTSGKALLPICNFTQMGVISYAIQLILCLIGTYLAMRLRDLPERYNESKLVSLAIYNSTIFKILSLLMQLFIAKSSVPETYFVFHLAEVVLVVLPITILIFVPKMFEDSKKKSVSNEVKSSGVRQVSEKS